MDPRPLPPALTDQEVKQTPQTVHRKFLDYLWSATEWMDNAEDAVDLLNKR